MRKEKSEPEPGLSITSLGGAGLAMGIGLAWMMGNIAVGIATGLVLTFLIALVYERTTA